MTKICHYTSPEKALKILSTQQFKFGHLENSNDPFENLMKRYELSFNIGEPLNTFMNEIFEYANTQISVASFGLIKDGANNDQNWTMWAHYAKKHSGVCFTFDLESILSELNKLSVAYIHDNIKYTNSLLISPRYFEERMDRNPFEILNEFSQFLLFSKHSGWKSESEYRIVVFKKEIVLPIKSYLKQVLLGPEIEKWYETRIVNILIKENFIGPFGKLQYAFGSYAKPSIFFFQNLKEPKPANLKRLL